MLMPDHAGGAGLIGAVGLGLLTALHPCPLSTLAAAVMMIFAPGQSAWRNLLRGASLVAGMSAAYVLAAAAIAGGILQMRFLSGVATDVARPFLAPLLIVAGILQTGLFTRPAGSRLGARLGERLRSGGWGMAGIAALGMGLALAFCPATAGLFFGVLIPLAVTSGAPALYALGFGLGCGVPLLALTACLAAGVRIEALRRRADRWTVLSGWALIAVGALLTLRLL